MFLVFSGGRNTDAGFATTTPVKNEAFDLAEGIGRSQYNATGEWWPTYVVNSKDGTWGYFFNEGWTGDLRP